MNNINEMIVINQFQFLTLCSFVIVLTICPTSQIEGAFVMGIGNVTTEEIVYDDNGRLLTDGTWEYKPPCSKTIPQVSDSTVVQTE